MGCLKLAVIPEYESQTVKSLLSQKASVEKLNYHFMYAVRVVSVTEIETHYSIVDKHLIYAT